MAAVSDPPTDNILSSNQMDQSAWENSWSMDEVRKSSTNWTLAGDAGLLNYLQSFSQKLISETHGIEKELTKLVQDTKGANSKLNNAVNDFLNLSNTQFVENRVYEEDNEDVNQDDKKVETKDKTKQEKEAELIPKISSALNFGLAVIDTDFIRLELDSNDSDSEDEDNVISAENLLEPKDPYVNRNLPFLIGSSGFIENDFVGLQDDASEEETADQDEDSDKGTETDVSDSELESELSESSISDDEEHIGSKKKKIDDESWEDTDGSDMFNNTKEDKQVYSSDSSDDEIVQENKIKDDTEDEADNDAPVTNGKMDFNAELTKKLGLPSKKIEEESPKTEQDIKRRSSSVKSIDSRKGKKDRSSSKRKSKSSRSRTSTVQESEADMFPPEIDDDELSPFSKKGGMFSGGGSLFDDSDEGGLFADIPEKKEEPEKEVKKEKKKEKSPSKHKSSRSDSLFGDENDGNKKKTRSPSKASTKKHKSQKADSLFHEDDDDDLFSSKPRAESSAKSRHHSVRSRKDTKNSDMFDDEESISSVEPRKERLPSGKQLPPGAVSMFGGGLGNSLQAALKSRRVGEDSESEHSEDNVEEIAPSLDNVNKRVENKDKAEVTASPGLFDDDKESNDLFSTPKLTTSKVKAKAPETFGGSSLFSDDEESGNLFSSKSSPAVKKTEPAKSKSDKKSVSQAKSTSLFDKDDDEDDLFFVAAKPKDSGKKKPAAGISLFDDEVVSPEEDKPLIKEAPKQSVDVTDVTDSSVKKTRTTTALSLFDDDDDDDDDIDGNLFSSKPKASSAKKSSASTMLFEDEDILFQGSEKESPDVDLFAEKPAKKAEVKVPSGNNSEIKSEGSSLKSKPNKAKQSIFDDEDDDDDFMSAPAITRDRPPSILNEGFESSTEEVKKVALLEPPDSSTTEETNDSNLETVEPVSRAKKLPGAVSMFGGIDPFAAKAQLKSPKQSPRNETKSITDPLDKITRTVDEEEPEEEPKVKATSPMNLNINPAALLPGAKPPVKEFKEESISFDDPPEAKTLHNVVKSRNKGGVKRRPPSRKGRQTTARMSVAEIVPPADIIPESEPSTKSAPTTPMKTPDDNLSSQILPPDFDDSDTIPSYATSNLPDDIFSPDTEEEDLFSVAPVKSELGNAEDEFSNSSIFSTSKKNVVSNADVEEDEFFSPKIAKDVPEKSTESHTEVNSRKVAQKSVDDDADVDLFSVPTKTSTKKVNDAQVEDDIFNISSATTKSPSKRSDILLNDDDDIFNVPSASKSSSKKKESNQPKNEEISDIFSSKKSSTNVKKPKAAANLFADQDGDDIFSNLGPSKKTSKLKSNKSSLFDDDDSDIFANVSSSKPRSNSNPKSKRTVPKKTMQTEDIFDDPLMGGLK